MWVDIRLLPFDIFIIVFEYVCDWGVCLSSIYFTDIIQHVFLSTGGGDRILILSVVLFGFVTSLYRTTEGILKCYSLKKIKHMEPDRTLQRKDAIMVSSRLQ